MAIRGFERDGHDYILQAIKNGASAIVIDVSSKGKVRNLDLQGSQPSFVWAENTRAALGLLCAAWYGFPSKKLKIIGVTGTDGKTTTTNLIYHILKKSGKKVGMVSTINARIGNREIDTGFHVTNPTPELLHQLLYEMANQGAQFVVLEVTSHGIDQERIAGVDFYGAVVTNVTHEHLDYHKTYLSYLETKGKLFKDVSFSVLNRDDRSFEFLSPISSGKVVTYGFSRSADYSVTEVKLRGESSSFKILNNVSRGEVAGSSVVKLNLPGRYNIYNALAAVSVCSELGLDSKQIKNGLETFSHLEGRFDEVKIGQPFRVVVDFAHTPNALEQVLELSSGLRTRSSKLVVVFGCAGERDREKRPMMGEIAGKFANLTVITAEDPRRENLEDIINQIADGCKKAGAEEVFNSGKNHNKNLFIKIPDRKEAIGFALKNAAANDIVIITGKGHEKSMCYGTVEYPWSDKKAVEDALGEIINGQAKGASIIGF